MQPAPVPTRQGPYIMPCPSRSTRISSKLQIGLPALSAYSPASASLRPRCSRKGSSCLSSLLAYRCSSGRCSFCGLFLECSSSCAAVMSSCNQSSRRLVCHLQTQAPCRDPAALAQTCASGLRLLCCSMSCTQQVILPACLFNLRIGHPGAALLLGSAGVITAKGNWYRPQRACWRSDGGAVLACGLTLELPQVSIWNRG